MAGGCSWTRNWLTFDNSYYLLGLQYNSHSKDSYHLPSRGDAAVLNSSILSSARKDKRPTTATRRDAAAGDAAAGRGSRSNSTDEGATTSLAPFFHVNGKPGDLMWLPTDEALKESPEFYKYFTRYGAAAPVATPYSHSPVDTHHISVILNVWIRVLAGTPPIRKPSSRTTAWRTRRCRSWAVATSLADLSWYDCQPMCATPHSPLTINC